MLYKKIMTGSNHKEIEVGLVVPSEYNRIFILLHGYGGSVDEVCRLFPLDEYASKYKLLIAVPELGNDFYLGSDNSSFLSKKLPEFIKQAYGIKDGAEIILGGYSMGGFGTMLHGLNNPDSFSALISVSGAFVADEIANGSAFVVGTDKQKEIAFDMFKIKDGELAVDVLPDDENRNPEAVIRHISKENINKLPPIVLTCGAKDIWCSTTQRVKKELQEKEIPFHYLEIVDGGHDFDVFDRGFRFAFDRLGLCAK